MNLTQKSLFFTPSKKGITMILLRTIIKCTNKIHNYAEYKSDPFLRSTAVINHF